ncbi:hypothetical protein [Faecalibacillus intestinalis]|jgi:hypothetical protein|uniref:hypothetical protein n=3 Tax=Faecalibacillus intestinalis TaxID=1982626 RepID=UPI000E40553C|nr:hypothetical protein [Faecalibacillus intestinalis]RGF27909.1 hypothetical protein DW109_06295 [Coprobacillus sp. AM09-26]RGG28665.1 hypothetical protein DWY19_10680 [Coprobacillus sp. AF24-1LB]
MSLFDLVINIIESSIMCYFIYKYFDFKQMEKLWLFILAVFATITAGNYFISESWLAIVLLAGVLILFLKVFNKKMSIENIIVCLSVLIMDLVCNMITLILGSSLDFIISDPAAKLKILMIVSKTMYLLFSLYILNRKMKYNSNLDTKRWTSIISVFLILLLELYILANDYTINNINPTDTLFCMFLTAIVTLVIFNIYGKLLKENEESTRIRLKNEEIRYKKENEKVLSKMSEDIYQLEHNLRYILMQVKLNEQNKKYDENIELIDQYIRNFGKFKAIINTDNPYFDYFMNQKINDLSNNGIDVHTSINISHSDYYLDREYVEYLIKVINLFKLEATQITINIYEKQEFNIIEVLTSKNMKLTFDNSLKQLAQHLDAQYKVTQDNELCVFKSIQSMK